MIALTRMDGKEALINEEWLVTVEENPDTTLVFASGLKLIVKESRQQLLAKIKAWQSSAPLKARKPRRLTRQ